MLKNSPFYNRTIRKIVVAFGTIFNEISIVRYNKANTTQYERIRVPLSYGAKEKYVTRLTSDPDLTKSIDTTLPRMSFNLDGMSYDSSRKSVSLLRNYSANTVSGSINGQYAPVPYNFDFSLSIYARNTEDGLQIIEQILPFFTPDFTVTVNLISNMSQKYDMPIILNTVSPSIDYEGDLMTTRMVMWDLSFTVKSHIFPAVSSNTDIIRSANTNIYIDTEKRDAQKVYVDYANGNSYFSMNETVRVRNSDVAGKITYFSNTSTGTVIIEELSGKLSVGNIIDGDYSGASYTIISLDTSPVKAVRILTRSDPVDAEPYEAYGFTEDFYNWPETLNDE